MPCEQIPISSVTVQNPPALLPPRSVCPLPICPSCRCRSQPLPGDSRKQRYNTLDFPTENRVPRKALPSFGNLSPRGTLFPSGHPLPTGMLLAPIGNPEQKGLRPSGTPRLFMQWLSIPVSHTSRKTDTGIHPIRDGISVSVFGSAAVEKKEGTLDISLFLTTFFAIIKLNFCIPEDKHD